MRTPSILQQGPGSAGSNGLNGLHDAGSGHTLSGRGWWLALAAIVPIGLSLLALGLRLRHDRVLDDYEGWWQARAAARDAEAPTPTPPAKIPTLFI